jgi:hypothetical protein
MNQYLFRLNTVFNFIVIFGLVLGCERSIKQPALLTIPDIELRKCEQTYSVSINNEDLGTQTTKITTGILKSFHNIQYSKVIEIKTIFNINNKTTTSQFYVKKKTDGYAILYETNTELNHMMFEFPFQLDGNVYGPFEGLTTQNVQLSIRQVHDSYTNKHGHIFNNVIEATNDDNTLRVYLNSPYFLIQKEDHRYVPIIHSLML